MIKRLLNWLRPAPKLTPADLQRLQAAETKRRRKRPSLIAQAASLPILTEPVDKPKVRRATKAEKKAAKRARHESN